MSPELSSLIAYSAAIVVGSLAGGALPLFAEMHGRRMDFMLAFSAGVMLGAAFFQMLPEAIHEGGASALPAVLVGALVLFVLERFVNAHACEEPPDCEVHGKFGVPAFFGMSTHTLFDGVALGSSLGAGVGTMVFLALIAHKVPASLALATILVHEKFPRRRVIGMLIVFALMVPLGAALYVGLRDLIDLERFPAYTLAFSAGTFLYLALADLLPQVHRASGARLRSVGAMLGGVAMMWALSLFGHGH